MKLSKTGLLLLILGILVIVLANLSAAHSQQVTDRKGLSNELEIARQALGKMQLESLSLQQAELQNQLEQANKQLGSNQKLLAQPLSSKDVSNNLFSIARDCNVQISSINSSGMVVNDLEGIPVLMLPLSIKVEGEPASLALFVVRLNESFSTGAVKSVDLAMTDKPGKSSAIVQLNIFTYRGDKL